MDQMHVNTLHRDRKDTNDERGDVMLVLASHDVGSRCSADIQP